jgi:hypothetical protein
MLQQGYNHLQNELKTREVFKGFGGGGGGGSLSFKGQTTKRGLSALKVKLQQKGQELQ